MCVTEMPLLQRVFAGLEFPAHRWQLVAKALDFGVDAATCDNLSRLPPASYADVGQVAMVLSARRTPAHRTPPARPTTWVDVPRQRTDTVPPGPMAPVSADRNQP